ncbi:hypothetical protein Efla_002941 [Eimeria flavescens]
MEALWGPPPPLRCPVAGGPGSKIRNYQKLRLLASCSKSTVWLVKRLQQEQQEQQDDSQQQPPQRQQQEPQGSSNSSSSINNNSSSSSSSSSSKLYALKEVPLSVVKSRKQAEHLWRERRCLEALKTSPYLQAGSHRLEECFKEGDFLFFVFNFIPGGPLYKHIRASGALTEEQTRWIAAELTETLGRLHAAGWTHRDLQASNVLLDGKGRPLLVDFGLVCQQTSDMQRSTSFCGTLHAMAPEVFVLSDLGGPSAAAGVPSSATAAASIAPEAAEGAPSQAVPPAAEEKGYWGPPVDWWGLGVLIYECLTGTVPFGYSDFEFNPSLRVHELAAKAPSSVSFPADVDISKEAKHLILALLQGDPAARLGSGEDAAEVKRHPFFAGVPWNLLEAPPGALSRQQEEVLLAAVPPVAAAAAAAAAAEELLQPQQQVRGDPIKPTCRKTAEGGPLSPPVFPDSRIFLNAP